MKKTLLYLGVLDLVLIAVAYHIFTYGYDFEVYSIGLAAFCMGIYRFYQFKNGN